MRRALAVAAFAVLTIAGQATAQSERLSPPMVNAWAKDGKRLQAPSGQVYSVTWWLGGRGPVLMLARARGTGWAVADLVQLPRAVGAGWLEIENCGVPLPGVKDPRTSLQLRHDPLIVGWVDPAEDERSALPAKRVWRIDLSGGKIRPVRPEGVFCLDDFATEDSPPIRWGRQPSATPSARRRVGPGGGTRW